MSSCWRNNFWITRETCSVKLNVRCACSSRQNWGSKQLPQFYQILLQTLRYIYFFIFLLIFYQVCRSWYAVAWDFEWTVWRQRFFNFWDLQRGQILGVNFCSVLFTKFGTLHVREHEVTLNDNKGIPLITTRLEVVSIICSPIRGTVSLVSVVNWQGIKHSLWKTNKTTFTTRVSQTRQMDSVFPISGSE